MEKREGAEGVRTVGKENKKRKKKERWVYGRLEKKRKTWPGVGQAWGGGGVLGYVRGAF